MDARVEEAVDYFRQLEERFLQWPVLKKPLITSGSWRTEAETRLLLSWRTRFSKVLQEELRSIGFRFASACPNFEPAYLDSLD